MQFLNFISRGDNDYSTAREACQVESYRTISPLFESLHRRLRCDKTQEWLASTSSTRNFSSHVFKDDDESRRAGSLPDKTIP